MRTIFIAYKNEVHEVNVYPYNDEDYIFKYKDMNRLMSKDLEKIYINGYGNIYCFDETKEGVIAKYNKYVKQKIKPY